jgi:hypothetical protein
VGQLNSLCAKADRTLKLTCHCENIQIDVAPPSQVTSCNCSVCSRYKALWGYYDPQNVKIHVGDAGENIYIRGDKELEFVRCAKCGCVTHYRTLPGQPDPRVAVNFGMAAEEAIAGVPVRYFDGKSQL